MCIGNLCVFVCVCVGGGGGGVCICVCYMHECMSMLVRMYLYVPVCAVKSLYYTIPLFLAAKQRECSS